MAKAAIESCSFCGKDRREVEALIESPVIKGRKAWICSECVPVAEEILALHRHGRRCETCRMKVQEALQALKEAE